MLAKTAVNFRTSFSLKIKPVKTVPAAVKMLKYSANLTVIEASSQISGMGYFTTKLKESIRI